jgi:hypothetical protein
VSDDNVRDLTARIMAREAETVRLSSVPMPPMSVQQRRGYNNDPAFHLETLASMSPEQVRALYARIVDEAADWQNAEMEADRERDLTTPRSPAQAIAVLAVMVGGALVLVVGLPYLWLLVTP